jgi:hypothetical protein
VVRTSLRFLRPSGTSSRTIWTGSSSLWVSPEVSPHGDRLQLSLQLVAQRFKRSCLLFCLPRQPSALTWRLPLTGSFSLTLARQSVRPLSRSRSFGLTAAAHAAIDGLGGNSLGGKKHSQQQTPENQVGSLDAVAASPAADGDRPVTRHAKKTHRS